mmetsp:Transcript_124097/g.356377  ORF Transcript_124097/g.356377 Transcript_124097/m.356377 type:complete len:159 (-) Transcript_124097:243-719(-)
MAPPRGHTTASALVVLAALSLPCTGRAQPAHAAAPRAAADEGSDQAGLGHACAGQPWDYEFASRKEMCARDCGGDVHNAAQCMMDFQHVSNTCGLCMGMLIRCEACCVQECDQGEEACEQCKEARQCASEFEACAGVELPRRLTDVKEEMPTRARLLV